MEYPELQAVWGGVGGGDSLRSGLFGPGLLDQVARPFPQMAVGQK